MLAQQAIERLFSLRLTGMAQAFGAQLHSYHDLSFEKRFGLFRRHRLRDSPRIRPGVNEKSGYLPVDPRAFEHPDLRSHWRGENFSRLRPGQRSLPVGFFHPLLSGLPAAAGAFPGPGRRLLPRLLSQLAKTELSVLDDCGLAPFTDTTSRDLLEVIDDRCQARSTIVASQLPGEHWHGLFPDPTVADAVLDRLIHNTYKINLKGESMRKVKSSLGQGKLPS